MRNLGCDTNPLAIQPAKTGGAERTIGFHEHFEDDEHPQGPTNRSFGLTVGGILLAIAGIRFYYLGSGLANGILLAAGGFLVILGGLAPAILSVPNRLWMALGRVMFRVVNPVIMLLMYIVCIVPVGLVMRAVGHDPLKRRFDAAAASYWVEKKPGDIEQPMKNQF